MGRLIYSAIVSADGYVTDESGRFDWAQPDEEVHRFINGLERSVTTALYGRRMYEVMRAWQTMGCDSSDPAYIRDFAESWRSADKIVYSTTLATVATPRTRIERHFDPSAVWSLKAHSAGDLSIGGPTLAAAAVADDLVDEYQIFIAPVSVGGGLPFMPPGRKIDLALVDERRFDSGMVYVRYTPMRA